MGGGGRGNSLPSQGKGPVSEDNKTLYVSDHVWGVHFVITGWSIRTFRGEKERARMSPSEEKVTTLNIFHWVGGQATQASSAQ